MTTTQHTPPDTRTMGVIHAALRRDFDRSALVLADPALATETRVRAVGVHLTWLVDFLHDHHDVENTRLYPLVHAANPQSHALLDAMSGQHAAVAETLHEAADAGLAAQDGRVPLAERTARLARAVSAVRARLNPHLEQEELELMPVVEASITRAQWDSYEAGNLDRTKRELATIGHWAIDGLPEDLHPVITGTVPAPVRFVMLHFMGGPYRRRTEAMWAGTAAADLGSQPLFARPRATDAP